MFWTLVASRGSGGGVLLRSLYPGVVTASRCTQPQSRSFSGTVPATQSEAKPCPVRRRSISVSPFVNVRTHLDCSISIRPLDTHAFPGADRAFITVHGLDSEQQEVGLDHLHVHCDGEGKELVITSEKINTKFSIFCPTILCFLSDLFITARGQGNVQIKQMECDICRVETEKGNCLLHSIRGHEVKVQSHGGNVTGTNTIHGNVDIRTEGGGEVNIKKLQGTKMNVCTESGSLKVKAIYSECSCMSSSSGKIELGHAHGKTTVRNVSGDTVIDGSNGFLKVSSNTGGIDVYVGDSCSAELHSQEGAVTLRVPSTIRVGVELRGTSVDVQDEAVQIQIRQHKHFLSCIFTSGYINEEPPADQWIKARADKGSVTLKTQSWFESLKLGS
uniref:Family with sequence similarity 185 member A n=1 Tax=Oryzias latipes TaxID=8090 RepID=A0A3P9MQK4_ORYLA